MLKQMSDMPVGTVGFEARGDVDDDDFEDVVAPVLRREIASGRKVRLLYLLGPQLEDFDGDVVKEEMKFAARHTTAYERVAIVSDESWLGPALRMLSSPGPRPATRVPRRAAAVRQDLGRRGGGRTRSSARQVGRSALIHGERCNCGHPARAMRGRGVRVQDLSNRVTAARKRSFDEPPVGDDKAGRLTVGQRSHHLRGRDAGDHRRPADLHRHSRPVVRQALRRAQPNTCSPSTWRRGAGSN